MLHDVDILIAPPFNFIVNGNWIEVKDGNATAIKLFNRHYSKYNYCDGRIPKLFVGPGQKIVLITIDGKSLFVWRKFKSMDSQTGVNCAVFRNEGPVLSSELILEAEQYAVKRWSDIRAYTYVNPFKIKSVNPGYCFKKAEWLKCGTTKVNKLIIFEKYLKTP